MGWVDERASFACASFGCAGKGSPGLRSSSAAGGAAAGASAGASAGAVSSDAPGGSSGGGGPHKQSSRHVHRYGSTASQLESIDASSPIVPKLAAVKSEASSASSTDDADAAGGRAVAASVLAGTPILSRSDVCYDTSDGNSGSGRVGVSDLPGPLAVEALRAVPSAPAMVV